MPVYEFRCYGCGITVERMDRTPSRCACGDTLRRKYSVNTPSPRRQFIPHFNHSVGRWVESDKHFKEVLREASVKQSEKMQMDINYQRIEAPDMAHTVDGSGLYEGEKARRDAEQGLRPKEESTSAEGV